jgi:F1F0 ATPase subunit 2
MILPMYLAAGFVAGIAYFRTVWWSSRRFAEGGRAATIVAVTIGRFVVLGGLLTLASLQGAMPLLMLALGIFAGRFAVMRAAAA